MDVKAICTRLALGCLFSLVFLQSHAQSSNSNYLKEGEPVPDVCITATVGDVSQQICMNELKGKSIILDFWAINCVDCIASMPDMLAFQQKYSRNLKVILVTNNSLAEVKALWEKFSSKKMAEKSMEAAKQLAMITQDTLFNKWFPYWSVPIHVWIDSNGIFRSIAYNSSTTEENIASFIAGKEVEWDKQRFLNLDYTRPLSWISDELITNKRIPYYNFLVKRIETGGYYVIPQIVIDSSTGRPAGITCMNRTILDLYKLAYENSMPESPQLSSRILIDVKVKQVFYPPNDPHECYRWMNENMYCYASKRYGSNLDQIHFEMRKDLDDYFHFRSRVEKRKVECLILKKSGSGTYAFNGKMPQKYERLGGDLFIQNMGMDQVYVSLINSVRNLSGDKPFLDETDYTGMVNVRIFLGTNESPASMEAIRKSLRVYGLDIVREYREIEMLVIQDQ